MPMDYYQVTVKTEGTSRSFFHTDVDHCMSWAKMYLGDQVEFRRQVAGSWMYGMFLDGNLKGYIKKVDFPLEISGF